MTGLRFITIAGMAWTLIALGGIRAEDHDAQSGAAGARFERGDGWRRLDVQLPGKLVSYALPRVEDGGRRIVLLVEPVEGQPPTDSVPGEQAPADPEGDERKLPPCAPEPESEARQLALYRLDPKNPQSLILMSDRIPHEVTAIDAINHDGNGADKLMLAREGELFLFDPSDSHGSSDPESVLKEPGLRWSSLHPRAARYSELDGWAAVPIHRLGEFLLHGPGDGGGWTLLSRVEMPIEARVSSRGMRIHSIAPDFIGRRADGTLLLGTPAETHGKLRLHTKLVEIPSSGEARITESWSRLPAPEMVLERHFIMLDERPVLLVTTKAADKLNLFGEKRLRLYPVERDLSRLGRNPLLATTTRMNLWQDATPIVTDVDADGRTDLVLGYWKGLKDSRVVLDVYLREEDGSFRDKPRTTAFNVEDGDRSFVQFGQDLDGDTHPDLLLRNESGTLLLFPSLSSTSGKKLVSSTPRPLPFGDDLAAGASVEMVISVGGPPTARAIPLGQPRLVDLDGDDRTEMLLVRPGGGQQPGAFRALWLE